MILTRFVVVLLGSLMLAASVGLGLGWLSRHLFVAALGPCFYGLAAGAGAGFVALMVGLHHKSLTFGAAVLGVLAGWLMFTAMDDFHFREAWAREWAETRMVSSGLPSAELTQGEQDFFGAGATEELERQVEEAVGSRGAVARWLFRADEGIRLLGPWRASYGLDVGRGGAVVWAVFELLLGMLAAHKVLSRIRLLVASEPLAALEDLDGDTKDDQSGA